MKIVQLLSCTAALCVFSTGSFADEFSAALAQANTDYVSSKQECRKVAAGEKRDACLAKAQAANKKNVAEIKAKQKKATEEAAAKRKKAIEDATAEQKKAKDTADAAYLAALKKAEADYDAKVPKP
jgi:hypothetical protein